MEGEKRAAASAAVAAGGNLAAVLFDEIFDEGVAKTEAAVLALGAAFALAEAVEDVGKQGGFDALAVVADLDPCGGLIAREIDGDGSTLLRELHGIGEKVPDHLADAVGIAGDVAGAGVDIDLKENSLERGGGTDGINGFVDQHGEFGGGDFKEELSRDDARDVEHIINQLRLRADVAVDDRDAFLDVFGGAVFVAHDGNPAQDGVERRAHFVRQGGEEDVFGAVGGFGFDAEGLFVDQHGFAFALELLAGADVADVALDDLAIVLFVDVADEFDGDVAAIAVLQGEIFVADGAGFEQLEHGGFVFGDVGEDADFPEFLADEIRERKAEDVEEEAVGVDDFPRVGIDEQNAVVSGFQKGGGGARISEEARRRSILRRCVMSWIARRMRGAEPSSRSWRPLRSMVRGPMFWKSNSTRKSSNS